MRWPSSVVAGCWFVGCLCVGWLCAGCGASGGRAAEVGRTVDLRPRPTVGAAYEILHRETREVEGSAPRRLDTRTVVEVLEEHPDGSRSMRGHLFRSIGDTGEEPHVVDSVVRFSLSARGEVRDVELECGTIDGESRPSGAPGAPRSTRDAELTARSAQRVERYLRYVFGARALVARGVGEGSRWHGRLYPDAVESPSRATYGLDRVGRADVRARVVAPVAFSEGDVGPLRVTGEGRARGRLSVSMEDGFAGATDLRTVVTGMIRERGGRATRGTLLTRSRIRVRRTEADPALRDEAHIFDSSIVTQLIRQRIRAIQACYERQLREDPTLSGRVLVRFTIEPDGTVRDVSATENTTGRDEVAECVRGTIGRFRFTPGPVCGSVTFAYPFVFAPQT